MKIVGLDVSNDRVDAVVLEQPLKVAVRDFYQSPEFKKHHFVFENDADGVVGLVSLEATLVIIEPTGTYSYFWINALKQHEIPFLVADQTMIKSTRKANGGTDNKDDPFDALLLIVVYFRYYVEVFDRRYWVRQLDPTVEQMKRLLLDLKGSSKKQTAAINTLKSRLAWEYPAKAKVNSRRLNGNLNPDQPPAFWAWVAKWETLNWKLPAKIKKQFDNHYQKAMSKGEGTGLSQITREYATVVCQLHRAEALAEQEFLALLQKPMFARYHKVFDKFNFGERERGWILARIHHAREFHLHSQTPIAEAVPASFGVGKGGAVKRSKQAGERRQ